MICTLVKSTLIAGLLILSFEGRASCPLVGNVSVDGLTNSLCLDLGETLTSLSPSDIEGLLKNNDSKISANIRHQLQKGYIDDIKTNNYQGQSFEKGAQ